MKPVDDFEFDINQCRAGLGEFKNLLQRDTLQERTDILPFFKKHRHLAAFIGSYIQNINNFNKLAFEYPIYGDFKADLVVGESSSRTYCFVEFEGAAANSIFKKTNRNTREWSRNFEHGYSQIIDWFWKFADMDKTDDFAIRFGARSIKYSGLLIVGRSHFLTEDDKLRLEWRIDNTRINSKEIFCLTFDELYSGLESALLYYGPAYQAEKG